MAKITEYDKLTALNGNEVVPVDGDAGTKTVTVNDLAKTLTAQLGADNAFELLDEILTPEQHRLVYRGKALDGSMDWEAVHGSGTFKDLYIGDYLTVTVGGVAHKFRFADFNYFGGEVPHVVCLPDEVLLELPENDPITGKSLTEKSDKDEVFCMDYLPESPGDYAKYDTAAYFNGYARTRLFTRLCANGQAEGGLYGKYLTAAHEQYPKLSFHNPECGFVAFTDENRRPVARAKWKLPGGVQIPSRQMIFGDDPESGERQLALLALAPEYKIAKTARFYDPYPAGDPISYWLRDTAMVYNTFDAGNERACAGVCFVDNYGELGQTLPFMTQTARPRPIFTFC